MAGTRIKTHKNYSKKKGHESVPVKKLRRGMRKQNPRAHAEVVKKLKEHGMY